MPFASAYQSNKNKVRDIRAFTTPTKHSFYEHTNNVKAGDSPATTLYLQRANGNPVIQGLIGSDTRFDFRNVIIQPKLKISHPDDVYEQEADRIAEQVMSLPSLPSEPHAQLSTTPIDERIDRKCSACKIKEKEEEIKMGLQISRKSPRSNNVETSKELAEEINQIRTSNGTPLDTSTRQFMESAFEYDFSAVRIHTDKRSAKSAESINASAYTTGNDIIFSEGMYMPSTTDGRRLLSHELAHVIQQGAAENPVQRPGLARSTSMERSARKNKMQAAGLVQLPFGLPALQRKADIAQVPPDLPCNAFVAEPGHIPGTDVFFDKSSATLTASQKDDISAFVSGWVGDGSKDDVQVDGFASVDGPQELNWRLSCKRAETIKAELIAQGVPVAKITTVARGESTEFSATALDPNRRAIITKRGISVPSVKAEVPTEVEEALPGLIKTAGTLGFPPTITPASIILRPPNPLQIIEKCFAPSELVGEDIASVFGGLAEKLIEADYCSTNGCVPGITEYFDTGVPTDGTYVLFLVLKNPKLRGSEARLNAQVQIKGGMRIPDILVHKTGTTEFYEIKPDSVSGIRDGRAKMGEIRVFYQSEEVPDKDSPYRAGDTYLSSTPKRIADFKALRPLTKAVEAFLIAKRDPGQPILYKLCIRGPRAFFTVGIGVAIILGILAARGIKIPGIPPFGGKPVFT